MFKRLLLFLGLFLFGLATFLALALVLVDPNDFDVDVAGWLSERLGREVQVEGALRYEFFPWLGVRVSGLRVAQPEGFGEAPFLTVQEARLRVRLVPLLLRQEVALDRIEVLAPELLLQRTPDGRNNWQDLVQRLDALDSAAELPELQVQGKGRALPVRPFDWQGLSLAQGSVVFRDGVSGELLQIGELTLRTDPGLDFGYYVSCSLASRQLQAVAELTLHGSSILRLQPFNLLLQNAECSLEAEALVEGVRRRGGFSGIADIDLQAQSLELKQATLRVEGMRLGGVLSGERLLQEDFALRGELELLECSPESLLADAPAPLCDALQNLAASTAFRATRQQVVLEELDLVAPGAALQGRAALLLDPAPSLDITLASDTLDLDALLPQGDEAQSSADESAQELLPPWLRHWPADIPPLNLELEVADFRGAGLAAQGVALQARATPGSLQFDLQAQDFLQGGLVASWNSQQDELYITAALEDADANALSTLLFGAPHVQGRVSLDAQASSAGGTAESLWRNLRLQGDLRLAQSALDFTSPPKLLGASPQPSFRFDACRAKVAMSITDKQAPASRLPFAYTVDASFTELYPGGLFTEPIGGKRYPENVNGDFSLRGTALMDAASPDFIGLENTAIELDYSGPGIHIWPGQHWDFTGQAMGRVNMAQDVIGIADITGSLPGLPVQGSLTIEHVFKPGPPSRYSGAFLAPDFVPRRALPHVGITPGPMAWDKALGKGSLDAAYAIDDRQMDIEVLQLLVDETAITGAVSLEGLDRDGPLLYRLDLTADALRLDDYLPPDEDENAQSAQNSGDAADKETWNSQWLQDLRMAGSIGIGRLEALDLRYDEVRASLEAGNGGLRLRPISSRFYGGELFGLLALHTLPRKEGIGISTECSIADFDLEEVIRDLGGGDVVGGNASWDMNLAGGGTSMRRLMQTLSGKARFDVEDGFYTFSGGAKRQTPTRSSRMLGAKPKKDTTPGRTRTPFSEAEATFIVENGQVRNDDFHVQGLIIQAHGSGRASLPAKTLDYTILVQMTGAPTIPVHIHGPFAAPSVEVSQREMLTDTVGRLGGSVFNVFKSILTLPFKAVETLQKR